MEFENVTESSISVSWNKTRYERCEIYYDVTYYHTDCESGENITSTISDIVDNQLTLTGLEPYTNYSFCVYAHFRIPKQEKRIFSECTSWHNISTTQSGKWTTISRRYKKIFLLDWWLTHFPMSAMKPKNKRMRNTHVMSGAGWWFVTSWRDVLQRIFSQILQWNRNKSTTRINNCDLVTMSSPSSWCVNCWSHQSSRIIFG